MKQVSVFIKFPSASGSSKNEHRNPITNWFYAPTKVRGCTKYEHDPINTVGCSVVMTAGQADGQTDRWTDRQRRERQGLRAKIWSILHRLPQNILAIQSCNCPAAGKNWYSARHFNQSNIKLEWAASNGNRYPPYPQLMATAISQ